MSIFDHFSESEQAILKWRAERVARATNQTEAHDAEAALIVIMRDETYAMPIEDLTGVYENIPVVPVPCAPPYVAGIANIRGHIIPVMDFVNLLGMPASIQQENRTLVIASNDRLVLAFQVDSIGDVIALNRHEIAAAPINLDSQQAHYIQGVLSSGVVVLNMLAILDDPALVAEATEGVG
jgi:purine-binding chemotaxis protein CheW